MTRNTSFEAKEHTFNWTRRDQEGCW